MTIKVQETILDHAIDLLYPISAVAESDDGIYRLLDFIGWDASAAGLSIDNIQTAFGACKSVIEQAGLTIEQGIDDIAGLIKAIHGLSSGIEALHAIADNWNNPGSLPADLPQTFVQDLFFWLLDVYMTGRLARVQSVLELFGLINRTPHSGISLANGAVIRRPMTRMRLDFSQVERMLNDPSGLLYDRFVNGENGRRTADATFDLLAPYLLKLLKEFGLSAYYGTPGVSADDTLSEEQKNRAAHFLTLSYLSTPENGEVSLSQLDIILHLVDLDGEFALIVFPVGSLAVETVQGLRAIKLTTTGDFQPLVISRGESVSKTDRTKVASRLNWQPFTRILCRRSHCFG